MKKINVALVMVVVMLLVVGKPSVAYAATVETSIVPSGITERVLSEAELDVLPDGMLQTEMMEENQIDATGSSYEIHQYSQTFDFYVDGTWVAAADASCIVYRYSDGKVHLASREITLRRLASYGASKTYGSIVNTDGSVCYTTGDIVTFYNHSNIWKFAIDFAATPTGQSFNCYEIDY